LGAKWRSLPFSGVPCSFTTNIAQKAVSLQPAKFHAILTSRPMISTSAFLPYAMISSVHESLYIYVQKHYSLVSLKMLFMICIYMYKSCPKP